MKNKRAIPLLLAISAVVLCLSGCNGIKKLQQIKITSASVEGFVPDGIKGIKLDCQVGIDNPGSQVFLSDIFCKVKHFGKVIGNVAVDPFTIEARTGEKYDLKAYVGLGDGVNILTFGKFLNKTAINDFTVDIHVKVKMRGLTAKELKFNDIPLKKLIETAKR